jgi:TatD DNase family protein
MLVDSHCHLDCIDLEKEFSNQFDNLIKDAESNGVSHMLCVSIEPKYLGRLKKINKAYPNVYYSFGLHPNVEPDLVLAESDLISEGNAEHCIAIGETGLDYFRSEGALDWQRARFRTHIKAATHLDKPLIIHMREATEDTLRIMKEEEASKPSGVMHCFSEDWQVAKKALDLGFYISLSGVVTFKNAHALKDVAKKVPLDRLLVETDSPYLAPTPHRGKQNRPAWVRLVAECVAELRGVSFESIAEKTSENFFRLFKLQGVDGLRKS